MLIVALAIFQRQNPRPTHACRHLRCPWATREGRAREGSGTGRRTQDVAEDLGRNTGRGAGLGLRGPGGARISRHATAAVFVQLALRWGSATGQLSGIWLGLWASTSRGSAESA